MSQSGNIFFVVRVIRVRFEQLTGRFELISTLRDLQSIFWSNKEFSNMNTKLLEFVFRLGNHSIIICTLKQVDTYQRLL